MEFAFAIATLAVLVVIAVALWRRRIRLDRKITDIIVRPTSMTTIPPELPAASIPPPVSQERPQGPKCLVCDETPTEPAPQIKRSRGAYDWVRELFASTPRYTRIVDRTQPWVLCKSHAHVADSMVEHFIHAQVRAAQTEMNQRIAVATAAFEQEGLEEMLRGSLTDGQKKRKSGAVAPLRVLPRTGTDSD